MKSKVLLLYFIGIVNISLGQEYAPDTKSYVLIHFSGTPKELPVIRTYPSTRHGSWSVIPDCVSSPEGFDESYFTGFYKGRMKLTTVLFGSYYNHKERLSFVSDPGDTIEVRIWLDSVGQISDYRFSKDLSNVSNFYQKRSEVFDLVEWEFSHHQLGNENIKDSIANKMTDFIQNNAAHFKLPTWIVEEELAIVSYVGRKNHSYHKKDQLVQLKYYDQYLYALILTYIDRYDQKAKYRIRPQNRESLQCIFPSINENQKKAYENFLRYFSKNLSQELHDYAMYNLFSYFIIKESYDPKLKSWLKKNVEKYIKSLDLSRILFEEISYRFSKKIQLSYVAFLREKINLDLSNKVFDDDKPTIIQFNYYQKGKRTPKLSLSNAFEDQFNMINICLGTDQQLWQELVAKNQPSSSINFFASCAESLMLKEEFELSSIPQCFYLDGEKGVCIRFPYLKELEQALMLIR